MADAAKWKFVSPDYTMSAIRDKTPDFRYLLYWELRVKVEKSGEATFHFYTGDVKGDFVIKVVGMPDEGEMMEVEAEIKVDN